MTEHRVITSWTGFCASCPMEQPLLLVSRGPHGLRAWLSGAGPEDRALSYVCAACGRVEHVPATEEEDVAYDAALSRWPDLVLDEVVPAAPAPEPVAPAAELDLTDVFGLAATRMAAAVPAAVLPAAPAPRPGTVHVVRLPVQRVSATDLVLTHAA